MKTAIVNSSDIARFGRMDAEFHIAYQEVKDRVAELEAKFAGDPAKALALLEQLPASALACVDVLGAGSNDVGRNKMRRTSCERYPFIALALVEREIGALQKDAQTKIDEAEAAKALLSDFQSTLKP